MVTTLPLPASIEATTELCRGADQQLGGFRKADGRQDREALQQFETVEHLELASVQMIGGRGLARLEYSGKKGVRSKSQENLERSQALATARFQPSACMATGDR